jgi:hypothetical protein
VHENSKANDLAQQTSGYNVGNKNFNIIRKSMCLHVQNLSRSVLGIETSLSGSTVGLTNVPHFQTGLIDTPTGMTGPADPNSPVLENSASSNLELDKADAIEWRRPIIDYLRDPRYKVDRKVQRFAFKFTLVEGELYH